MIREARPDEFAALGDLRVAAYEAGGFLNPEYAPELRALGTQGDGTVLVAVPEDRPAAGPTGATAYGPAAGSGRGLADGAGPIAGTIMLVTWPLAGELVGGRDEAEIRALAVAPGVRNGGVGTGLLLTALNWAELAGARRVV